MTNKLALVVAVILAVLSILGIRTYVESMQARERQQQDLSPFLIAAHDLPEGHVVTADDIEVRNFPRAVLRDALRGSWIEEGHKAGIMGTRTRTRIQAGTVLQHLQFHARAAGSQILTFPDDQRAFTIPVDRVQGLSGMLKPGDYVDLIIGLEFTDPTGRKLDVTRTLLKNKLVLATDQNINPHEVSGAPYQTLTLRLYPEECNKLVFVLSKGGMVHCALVKEGTATRAGFDPVTADSLYQEIAPELRSPRPTHDRPR